MVRVHSGLPYFSHIPHKAVILHSVSSSAPIPAWRSPHTCPLGLLSGILHIPYRHPRSCPVSPRTWPPPCVSQHIFHGACHALCARHPQLLSIARSTFPHLPARRPVLHYWGPWMRRSSIIWRRPHSVFAWTGSGQG